MKHELFFRKHPVFTGEELKRHLSALGETGPRTRESLMNYHSKTGHVILIRRGLSRLSQPEPIRIRIQLPPFLLLLD